jgi:hypothetical protein
MASPYGDLKYCNPVFISISLFYFFKKTKERKAGQAFGERKI